ncbi:MAG: alpha/beta fold hydrolase [Caldimonas sp.]
MTAFVLVHGAWHGAWCWRRVLPPLWTEGHRAFAVSLSGVGERAHVPASSVTLQVHIDDIVNVIEAEELHDVVLVGHSYAGMLITGAVGRIARRLSRLIYVDAIVPHPGEAWSRSHSEATRAERRRIIAATGMLPPPDPSLYGLEGADADWVARRQTAQPGRLYDEELEFDSESVSTIPRTFISCVKPALQTIEASRHRARTEPGWTYVELETGHDPMISAPQALLDILLSTP